MIVVLLALQDKWGFLAQEFKERRVWKDHVDPLEAEDHRVRVTPDRRVIKVYQVRLAHQEKEEQVTRVQKENLELLGCQDYRVCLGRMALQDRRENRGRLG